MKVFIVGGGGAVGSAVAGALITESFCREIVLYDIFPEASQARVMDLSQAFFLQNAARIRAGGWEALPGSDVVVVAAGLPAAQQTKDYYEDSKKMLPMLQEIAERVTADAPNAIVITLTNPVNLVSHLLWKLSGLPARQFIGMCLNDSARVLWALQNRCGTAAGARVHVLGEHGPVKTPIRSSLLLPDNVAPLSEEDWKSLVAQVGEDWQTYLRISRGASAVWTTGRYTAQTIRAAAESSEFLVDCAVSPEGAYGLSGTNVTLPVRLDRSGVCSIPEFPLSHSERAVLEQAAAKTRDVLERLSL